jgi:Tfp pilus assembly protein PilO
MDRIKDLLDRLPYSLILVGALGYIGFGYYQFLNSPDSPLITKKAQVEKASKDNAELQKKIKDAQEFYRTLDQKRMELRQLAQQLDEMKAVLTDQLDMPGLTKMFYSEASKVGLRITNIKPLIEKSENYYAYQGFQVDFRGVYVQLLVFLERLSTVERIVRIETLNAAPTSAGAASSPYVELSGSLEVKAYKYVGSDADRLGRSTEATPAPASTGQGAPGTPQAGQPAAGGTK